MLKLLVLIVVAVVVVYTVFLRPGVTLGEGDVAPAFSAPDQDGNTRSLAEFRGKWVALYFYPKDDTPGCTQEACAFRDEMTGLKSLGVQVLGVSVDDTKSHAAFAKKFHLPFPLIADPGGDIARRYGTLLDLGVLKFARRHSFLIKPDGHIARAYRKVSPEGHAREIAADVKRMRGGS